MKIAVAAVLAATAATASAGTYLGVGVGPGPAVHADAPLDEHGRAGRLIAGYSFSRLAIEGTATGFDLGHVDRSRFTEYSVRQLAIAGKLSLPIGSGFEGFGKLGLHQTWFSSDAMPGSVTGSGMLFGAGIALGLDAIIAKGSLFLEYSYSAADLDEAPATMSEVGTRLWMLGFTIGL